MTEYEKLRESLEKIMGICMHSRQYSRRIECVHEEAMQALGLGDEQRSKRHYSALRNAETAKKSQVDMRRIKHERDN